MKLLRLSFDKPYRLWSEEEKNDFIAKVNEHHAKGGDVVVVGEKCFYCGTPVDPKIKNNPAFLLGNDKNWESKPKLVMGMCERCGLMAKGGARF